MSSLVLLNAEGALARKLHFVTLPDDYVVPEGMTISWMTEVKASSRDSLVNFIRVEPVEGYFYLGDARGQVSRSKIKEYERDDSGDMHYGSRTLTIIVQGTSAKEVMKLRDCIMQLINNGVCWGVINDLNQKPKKIGFLRRLFGSR